MNTNALRQKILDLAIHGKLVKQDPADESAAILLEKIRAEKEKKIASGELKRGKNDSYIFFGDDNRHYEKFADGRVKDIEDEIPFAVPEGWAWCRLGEICEFKGGGTPDKLDLSYWGGDLNWASVKDIKGKFLYSTEDKITELGLKNSAANLAKIDDIILITRILPGKAIITKIETAINQDLKIVLPKIEIEKQFLLYFFKYVENDFVEKSNGTTVKGIKLECLTSTPFPLPPLAEQQRIVTAIETIFAQIDILETNKADLQTAIKQAKSKILDLAIRGKLVPQDPADEPARVMLEKLRAEKEAKIASGEIKRGKNDSYIYKNSTDNCYYQKYTDGCEENISDEIPFTVPEGWMWCRLPNLCKIPITDGTHQTPTYSDKEHGIPFLSSKDVTSRKIDWSKIKYITKELHEELQKRVQPCRNDILLAKNGTTGVAALVDTDKIFDIYVTLALLRPAEVIHPNYLHYVINSPFCKKQFNSHLTGIGVPNLHLNDICKTIIPLPPLFEQQRIVTKIEGLFAKLDFITTTLTE
ncbi:restriction endonuclease subunit S [Treponema denticola]